MRSALLPNAISVLPACLVFGFMLVSSPASFGLPQPPEEVVEGALPQDEITAFEESAAQTAVDQILNSLVVPSSETLSDVVRLEEGARAVAFVRHTLQWLDFVQKVALDIPSSEIKAAASEELRTKLQAQIRPDLLARPVISQEQVSEALVSCHPTLAAAPVKPRPPFFNNPTGFLWDPENDYLAFEANAVLDVKANRCVRGIVDLRTGDVVCLKNIACVIG